ncbi:SDR family NAD(P)-dependent oxidoreductase [Streptomyces sp. NPDC007883]|uniref:SDR family NAD(P)-dependent oxidoreductase n=1 Tax=Streptomyces sp. NPDC007883 TaxID=3155116 RepID=UPI0033E42A65
MEPLTLTGPFSVTRAEIDAFAQASGDRSPLHVEEAYASRTPFGEPVAHGALCALKALATGPARPGLRLAGLTVRFPGPVLPGRQYVCTVTETGPSAVGYQVLDGGKTLLDAEAVYERGELSPVSRRTARPRPTATAAEAPLEQLVPGTRIGEAWRPDWTALRELSAALGLAEYGVGAEHAAVLAWASQLAGMEAPGRSALVSGMELAFEEAGTGRAFTARGEITEVDTRFRAVRLTGEVSTGRLRARVEVRAFARREAAAPSAERIRELLAVALPTPVTDGLKGRTAFVTGGSRGLGAALVQALAVAGATVHLACRHSRTEAEALVAGLGADGLRVRVHQGDVGDVRWCAEVRERILAQDGPADLVVLNAGPAAQGLDLHTATVGRAGEHVRRALELAQAPLAAFAEDLAATYGRLLAVSSAYVSAPRPGFAHYTAAKSAVEGLVRAAAAERPGIGVLIARPPRLATGFADAVAAAEPALPVEPVAAELVRRLAAAGSGGVELAEEFGEPADAPAQPPAGQADVRAGGEPLAGSAAESGGRAESGTASASAAQSVGEAVAGPVTASPTARSARARLESAATAPAVPRAGFAVGESAADAESAGAQGGSGQAAPGARGMLAVAATFTTDPLAAPLTAWMDRLGLGLEVRLAPYGQVFQELLDPQSTFAANRHGCNAVLLRPEDWPAGAEGVRTADEFAAAAAAFAEHAAVPLAVLFAPPSPGAAQARGAELAGLEEQVRAALAGIDGVHLTGSERWSGSHPVPEHHDAAREQLAHIPYTPLAGTALATTLARQVHALLAPPFKVLVLDCDHTLWGGVVGEDGPDGIRLDPAHLHLQQWAVEQHDKGVLIALSSKNSEDDVDAAFRSHPAMPLRPEHIAARRIDWNPKPGNIAALAAELGLGLDSLVFLDDNPVEVAAVRAACPGVLALALPADGAETTGFLDRLWAFDRPVVTDEDRRRTAMYRASRERELLRDGAGTLAEFIAGLGLRVDVHEARPDQLARVAQLTQRTNQFNLSGIRRTEQELKAVLADGARCWVAEVGDRFGEYGLVGAAVTRESAGSLTLETFLLSCRVLGRGVEHAFLAALAAAASEGVSVLSATYRPTPRNTPVRAFLDEVFGTGTAAPDGSLSWKGTCDVAAKAAFRPEARPGTDPVSAPAARPTAPTADPVRLTALTTMAAALTDAGALHDWITAADASVAAPASEPTGVPAPHDGRTLAAVREVLGRLRRLPADSLGATTTLESLRLESLEIVDATVALEARFGRLPSTLFFEHRTLGQLAAAVDAATGAVVNPGPAAPGGAAQDGDAAGRTAVGRGESDRRVVDGTAAASTPEESDDIAIVGIAGRFPGARDTGRLWRNLAAGTESIGDAAVRWGGRAYVDPAGGPGRTYTSAAGLIDGVDEFDAPFFGLAPSEAETMDPQQRLFLQAAYHALEDAGHTAADLGRNIGVYVASMGPDYAVLSAGAALDGRSRYPNTDLYQIANRVSHFFDFTGPSIAVDTACSGSGTALQLACDAIRGGTVTAAVAGGVNVILHPARRIQYAQLGMVSRTGRCRPFGADADGMVPSEGVGAVLLRPLRDALADGDHIHGVIKAIAANSDGRTNGFTVPSPDAQAELVSRTLRRAGIDPASIGYVEAHGTGTKLGDPIEIRGLARAYGHGLRPGSIPIGSVKGNIGHTEAAAAVAGLTKVLLQLRYRTLVPSLHSERLNPHIDFAATPFRVQQETVTWPAGPNGTPRRAALSSFGAGGVNVHLIVEEAPDLPRTATPAGPELIVLSARDEEALGEVCARLAAWLREDEGRHPLADIAYTLRAGREPLACRVAFTAGDLDALEAALGRLASPADGMEAEAAALGAAFGQAVGDPALAEILDGGPESTALRRVGLAALGRLWCRGVTVDWARVMPGAARRRVPLPGYPFRRTRHWLAEPDAAATVTPRGLAYYAPRWLPEPLGPAGLPADAAVVVVGGTPNWAVGADGTADDPRDVRVPGDGRELVVVDRRRLDAEDTDGADTGPAALHGAVAVARQAGRGRSVTYVCLSRTSEEDPASAAVSGLGRALAQESPYARAIRTEVAADAAEPSLAEVLAEVRSGVTETRRAGGERWVRRWRRLECVPTAPVLRARGHYLITGGAGGAGRLLAAHLAARCQARVTLLGRSPAPAALDPLREEVRTHGGELLYFQADITDRDALQEALTAARDRHGPLRGVVHAAGVLRDGTLHDTSDEDITRVLAPKVTGCRQLDAATMSDPLDFFLAMSSYVGTFGNAGQAGYCAANRFLDAFMEQRADRAARGLRSGRSVSAVWPLWEDGGMRMPDATRRLTETTLGLTAMGRDAALRAFEDVLGLDSPTVLIGCGDQERIASALAALDPAVTAPAPGDAGGADAAGEPARLLDRLREEAARLVKLPAAQLDVTAEFGDYGFNSLIFTDFANRLNDLFGLALTPVVFFSHPSLVALAQELRRRGVAVPVSAPAVPLPARAVAREPQEPQDPTGSDRAVPVAVIGMAGRFPGAEDLDTYWENLLAGRDLVTEAPSGRWAGPAPRGGFLDDILAFDAAFFGITPREARLMDPQQRLFLEAAWNALEDSGHDPQRLGGSRTGVFVGATLADYAELLSRAGEEVAGHSVTGHVPSIIANRLSYLLDLRGPSEVVDTACSSSLTALHRALTALESGECGLAVAGGVNALFSPTWFDSLETAGMLSATGRCWTFDERADGFIRGEGVGVVVLKPLDLALRDGDPVRGVIRGSAVNHGGRAHSLTAPNPQAQAEVVASALRRAGVHPRSVSFVETHGTGTRLGDPIEVAGLRTAFSRAGGEPSGQPWCALGAVKTGIGHLESAAGLAGLVKVLLAIGHRTLPPNAAGSRPNPHLELAGSPFRVPLAAEPWQPVDDTGAPVPLVGGVSAFGFGGANAHAVVAEPPAGTAAPQDTADRPAGAQVVVLSAATPQALRRYARRLHSWLAGTACRLGDLAHTSQAARTALPERLAAVASTRAELLGRLEAFLAGVTTHGLYTSKALRGFPPAAHGGPRHVGSSDGGAHALARRWAAGEPVDWPSAPGLRRVPFPVYPFDHARAHGPVLGEEAVTAPKHADHSPQLLTRAWVPAPTPAPAPEADRSRAGARLLLVGRDADAGLLEELAGTDARDWIVLHEPWTLPALGAPEYEIDFEDHEAGRRAARRITDRHGRIAEVLDLTDAWGGDRLGREAARIGLLQVLAGQGRNGDLAVAHLRAADSLAGARMAGLVRAVGAECGTVRSVGIEIEGTLAGVRELLRTAVAEAAAAGAEPEVRYRDGAREVRRLQLLADGTGPLTAGGLRIDPDRAYLVTGGTGGLGLAAAGLLVRRGARRIALAGRRPLERGGATAAWSRDRLEAVRRLEAAGAEVMLFSGPLSDEPALSRFLGEVRARFGGIAGVLHCAGSVGGTPAFVQKTYAEISACWEPKGSALLALDRALAQDAPDFVVLYSSLSAAVPALAVGLTDYAAGNALLDAYAEQRGRTHGSGTRYLAIDWGSWTGAGMGEVTAPRYRDAGLGALTVDQGLDLLDQALGTAGHSSLVAVSARPGAAEALLPGTQADNGADLTAGNGTRTGAGTGPRTGTTGEPVSPARPEPLSPSVPVAGPETDVPAAGSAVVGGGSTADRHMSRLTGHLVELMAEATLLDRAAIRPDVPFADLGVDSVLIAGLVPRLEEVTGSPLDPSVILEHPTTARLAAYLISRHPDAVGRWATAAEAQYGGTAPAEDRTTPGSGPAAGFRDGAVPAAVTPLAVIGMAGRFPGAASAAEFWELLREGRSGVREVPRSRWDVASLYSPEPRPGRSTGKWGGFLEGIEDFDPGYFGIPDADAAHMDPLVRLFLECAEETFADAGYTPAELAGRRIGVYVGSGTSTYGSRIGVPGRSTATGLNQNFIAAHLAHVRDLRGPNMVVDSACSSSLTALHLAQQALHTGDCEMALAGGADLILDETPYLKLSAAGALSPDGACHVFDAAANGLVPGEGVGAVLLKPLDRALADGDRVLAVIEATAVNNDGRTMGLTTPNPDAQRAVVREALARAGADAGTVSYVEAHGTGTMIGDPIELKALTEVFREDTAERGFCAVGSVKSNVGHLLMAAGMAGLQKVVLSLVHRALPPTLHCTRPNPRFAFETSPFLPNTELREWPARRGLRRAGISAFGFGGTNCHVVVRGLTDSEGQLAQPQRVPLPPPVFHRTRHWVDRQPPEHRATTVRPRPLFELEELS